MGEGRHNQLLGNTTTTKITPQPSREPANTKPHSFFNRPRKQKYLLLLLGAYAVTLFIGTVFVLWQLTFAGFIPPGVAEALLLPTFGLNFVIESIVCPFLLRSVSPRLRSWGAYSGTLWEWRRKKPSI